MNANTLVEIRLFTLSPGARDEFDRISREGTIPMMRRWGLTVLSHGPCLNDENGYYLVRAFESEQQRVEGAKAFYASSEWEENYEAAVMGMIDDYHTAVLPASPLVDLLLSGATAATREA
jgi:hypothetical protein